MVIDSGRRIEICQLCDNYHRLSLAFQDFMTYIFWQHLKLRYFWFLILELLFIEEPCKIQWLNFFVDLFLVGFIQVIWNFFIGFFIVQLFVCFTDIVINVYNFSCTTFICFKKIMSRFELRSFRVSVSFFVRFFLAGVSFLSILLSVMRF